MIKKNKWLATGRWLSPGTPDSYTNTTDQHDITEILLKVALSIQNQQTNVADIKGLIRTKLYERKDYFNFSYCELSM